MAANPADASHIDRYVLRGEASSNVEKISLKFGESFMVLDARGDLPASEQETGLYWHGARYLRALDLFLEGRPLADLSHSISDEEGTCQFDLTNPFLPGGDDNDIPHDSLHVRRRLSLRGRTCDEAITVTNYHERPVEVTLGLLVGSDFRDIFDIRGLKSGVRGQPLPPTIEGEAVTMRYHGADNVQRETRVELDPPPDDASPTRLGLADADVDAVALIWRLRMEPRRGVTLRLTARVWEGSPSTQAAVRWPKLPAPVDREQLGPARTRALPGLVSDNTFFNQMLSRGMHDLVMMCVRTPQGLYPYGGIPWYVCPFGRDALITSMEFLPWFPDVARGAIHYLAVRQGREENAFTEEQPGKILHELRRGELANLREIPFIPYYGTVDATPLFLVALERYVRWTNDTDFLGKMWQHALTAAQWILEYGDADGDGFLEYERARATGLVNQGWKDSWDAISHADGSLASGRIALSEVQGYAFAAFQAMAYLATRAGQPEQAPEWQARAERLRERFQEAFWWPEEDCFYQALDGEKRPCKVVSSNAGQVLWSGIASPQQSEAVVQRMMRSDMYTEWGIRTLSSTAARYNPMSYHNGSVWPHDTAMIGAGFARYGFHDEAAKLLGNLYGLSLHFEGARLPELFCGFARQHGYGPTRYPVACAPQSWAAGAPFLLLSALLGFDPDAEHGQLRLRRPTLPEWLHRLDIRGLRLGGLNGQMRFERFRNETAVIMSEHSEIGVHVQPA